MHTFFINTSGKELENYSDIFEIQHEIKRLVSLECPLTEWNDEEKGYKSCVHRMGELIDSYKDINNEFNLIIYIDLLSYDKYTSIPINKHRERYACLKALHSILKHYIKGTLVENLNECGRGPHEVLLIFEENQLPKDGDEITEDGKNLIRTYAGLFLGLPAERRKIDEIVYNGEIDEGEKFSPERFCDKIVDCSCSYLGKEVLYTYFDQIDTFISEVKSYNTSEQPVRQLLDRIIACSAEDDKSISSVTFVTDRRAGVANKQEKTRRNLRLCFYILSCVEDETVFDLALQGKDNVPCVKQFPEINWENVAAELTAKGSIFQKKYNEVQRISESFSEMGLAPALYSFDNQRFALDEYGKRGKTFNIVDVEDKQENDQESKNSNDAATIVSPKGKKAVVIDDVRGRSLFDKKEYPTFDYRGDDFDESVLGSKATADQYIGEAQKLRQHHLDYLQRLKVHVSDRLSNYAGRSAENDPALLRKRKVSVSEEDFEDQGRDYRYAKPGRPEENRKLKTVETISETAYTAALLDYMEFCAGRSVAVTDIEEQCNWFVTRINQIRESIRKIQMVAIGWLVAIAALYTPFVVLQWQGITENAVTFSVALLSIAVPVILLYSIFAITSVSQRKKYRKVWNEFKEKSDKVLEENAVSAEKYDQLLSVYIPTLRWVYEYKLDVDFYAECCKMARAKIEHHSQKIHDRVVTIGNIIEDLEIIATDRTQVAAKARCNTNDEIDYNVSFCSGSKNRKFYSIIDTYFLKSVNK